MRLLLTLFIVFAVCCLAAGQCPPNIGFEKGDFTGWQCYLGSISRSGDISVFPSGPESGRHTILKNTKPQGKDPYGGFPVNCPNGSGYSIQLGNSSSGAQAESVSYTFVVPNNTDKDYSIIYNYAVVFQNPTHDSYEQPKFTTKIFDVTANQYIDCGSFQFIATSGLPGFRLSQIGTDVYYKPWAPITLKLSGFRGKTIRIEFTTNDCSRGGHFGYAYLDVNENCDAPITGSTYCAGASFLNLKAPYGFQAYNWYTEDFSTKLGSENILKLSPAPPAGTKYALEIIPFPGQGCLDTLRTTIEASSDYFKLNTVTDIKTCEDPGADLTAPFVSAGSSNGLVFSYFTDINETNYVPTPTSITQSETYYIKAINAAGCADTKPVNVTIVNSPILKVNNPPPACAPDLINLLAPGVVSTTDNNVKLSFWRDAGLTDPIQNPASIAASGVYYVKAVNSTGCSTQSPIQAIRSTAPVISVKTLEGCGELNLAAKMPATSADPSVNYTYWSDAAATQQLPANHVFTSTTTYFVKATETLGCATIQPATVNIRPFPAFQVTNPLIVVRPAVADLTSAVPASSTWSYTYWLDKTATRSISTPKSVIKTGLYYIKATSTYGCVTDSTISVIVKDPPIIPPNLFSPNGDGINDTWEIPILKYYPECTVEIFNRSGQPIFQSNGYQKGWDGTSNGKPLPTATTYYYIIRLSKLHEPSSGSVTLFR